MPKITAAMGPSDAGVNPPTSEDPRTEIPRPLGELGAQMVTESRYPPRTQEEVDRQREAEERGRLALTQRQGADEGARVRARREVARAQDEQQAEERGTDERVTVLGANDTPDDKKVQEGQVPREGTSSDPGQHVNLDDQQQAETDQPERPSDSASKAEWVAYARAVSGEEIRETDHSKADLIRRFGGQS